MDRDLPSLRGLWDGQNPTLSHRMRIGWDTLPRLDKCKSADSVGRLAFVAPVRGLNLFSGLTQDLRPGLLSVAPAGLVFCADSFRGGSGCDETDFAGEGARATRAQS
jgi:hypothetical protein